MSGKRFSGRSARSKNDLTSVPKATGPPPTASTSLSTWRPRSAGSLLVIEINLTLGLGSQTSPTLIAALTKTSLLSFSRRRLVDNETPNVGGRVSCTVTLVVAFDERPAESVTV